MLVKILDYLLPLLLWFNCPGCHR